VRVHELTTQFGWPGDGGLGLRLIERIKAGAKTGTCCPVALCTAQEMAASRAQVGRVVTVIDRFGTPHCNVRMLEVFETPWGAPDARLVRAEEFADAEAWRAAMAAAWRSALEPAGVVLRDDTAVFAEMFELVGDED
jgi:uncharacterized protein YhfF